MAHWLGGWCPFCADAGANGAFTAVFGFEGWDKTCERCGRTPREAALDLARKRSEMYSAALAILAEARE